MIQRGLIDPGRLRTLALAMYAGGTVIGLVLAALRGWGLAGYGVAGFLLGYLYTAPPVRLVHRGLGELAVGLGFGPVMVMGAYWVQQQHWSTEALLASIPIGLMIAAVLYINEIPDRMWDTKAGKRTLITRLDPQTAITGYGLLMTAAYLAIVIPVALGRLPLPTLLGLLTIPMAWKAYGLLKRHHNYAYRLIPANATTVFTHFYTGLLLVGGYVIAILVPGL